MKKAFFVFLLSLLVTVCLSAETVLLCISDNEPVIDRTDWPQALMRAVEDGAMDVFFEAGHIVTNTVVSECRQEFASKLASENGADLVLMLTLVYPEEFTDNLPLPEKIIYTSYCSDGSEVLPVTELDPGDLNLLQEGGDALDLFTICGKLIAENAAEKAPSSWR